MIFALALIVVGGAVGLLLMRSRGLPSGWSAITDGQFDVPVDDTGSFEFPTSAPGIHYVTKPCGSLANAKQITMRYRIDGDPLVKFLAASDGQSIGLGPTLYFQRSGDDWSGAGKYETYRWWATFATPPLAIGENTITVPFSADWTAVETSHAKTSPQEFADALANAERIGFTFGGGTGYGHGAFATGSAKFTLLEFEVQ